MANFDNANGFIHAGGLSRPQSMTSAGVFAEGDLLELVDGQVELYTEGSEGVAVGVAMAASAAADETVMVETHPDAEFRVQCSGTYAVTSDGTLCDIEGGTGVMEADENAAVNGTLMIIGHAPIPGSDEVGVNSRILVKLNKHIYASSGTLLTTAAAAAATADSVSVDPISGSGADVAINTNFTDCAAEINALIVDVASIRTQLNAALSELR